MKDITIIMMTPNRVPKKWAEFHKEKLIEAIGDTPIITISKEPLDWGTNLIQTEYGFTNIFRQMLRGAKLATTPWIAIADDDTLYPQQHFAFRSKKIGFYYNLNRWHILTWGNPYYYQRKPFYFHKPRPGNGLLVCSRELLIKALEKRFEGVNKELPSRLSHELGTIDSVIECDCVKWEPFYTAEPVLSFYHEHGLDRLSKTRKKWPWPVRAFDIPIWGRAEEIVKKFQ